MRLLAIALGSLLVLVLIAGLGILGWTNRILAGGTLRRWVNGNPEKLFLDYGSASSSWPGRVRVRNLRLRARDPNVEWEVRIDDCKVTISLPDLLRKKFRATSVEAAGLTFRLRQRLNDGGVEAKRAAYLPPIEGFPAVPLRDHPRIVPGNTDDLWAIQLSRLVASPVREIWIDTYRYTGDAALSGSLDLHPETRGDSRTGDARVEERNARAFWNSRDFARQGPGRMPDRQLQDTGRSGTSSLGLDHRTGRLERHSCRARSPESDPRLRADPLGRSRGNIRRD